MNMLRDLEHSLPLQLLKARELAMASFRPMLRKHGLTEQQWRVIRVLAAQEGIDATTLANQAMLLAPSLTRILKHLEREALVARLPDRHDQRRATFVLTAAGKAKFAEVGPDSEQLYALIEARFGADNLANLYALLAKFDRALTEGKETENK